MAREQWGSRLGVILAVAGSAVGLGNFLRFPGQAMNNGGGTFMIPYLVALLLLGVPLAWMEWSMGRLGGSLGYNSTPGIFYALTRKRRMAYFGVLSLLIPVGIYMYYLFIEAWCLGYAWKYLQGTIPHGDVKTLTVFWCDFVGLEADGAIFRKAGSSVLPFLAICFAANFYFIWRGLNKGIEWFCSWALPALVVLAVVVLVRVLTLPPQEGRTVAQGLGAMWNPDFAKLGNAQIWLAAAGQIFFTLSVGMGVITTYASYMKRKDDVALSSLTAVAGNEFCEVVLGGLIAIPAAFLFLGQAGLQANSGTFSLGFNALPAVFAQMPAGNLFGFLFFFLLFLAAITSSLSMLQPVIAFLEEGLGLGRRASVAILGLLSVVGTGLVAWFSQGLTALDHMDFWIGQVGLFLFALVEVILFGWLIGLERGMRELRRGAEIPIPTWIGVIIKYVAPAYLTIIFVVWAFQQVTATKDNYLSALKTSAVVQVSIGFLVLVGIMFLFLIAEALQRWAQRPIPPVDGTTKEDQP